MLGNVKIVLIIICSEIGAALLGRTRGHAALSLTSLVEKKDVISGASLLLSIAAASFTHTPIAVTSLTSERATTYSSTPRNVRYVPTPFTERCE